MNTRKQKNCNISVKKRMHGHHLVTIRGTKRNSVRSVYDVKIENIRRHYMIMAFRYIIIGIRHPEHHNNIIIRLEK